MNTAQTRIIDMNNDSRLKRYTRKAIKVGQTTLTYGVILTTFAASCITIANAVKSED